MQRRCAFVAVSLATLAGCLSFDALSGGEGSDAGDAIDATTNEASSSVDSAILDASTNIGDAFTCDAFPDAALCDDFNRTTVIPFSDPRWAQTNCGLDASYGIVDDSFSVATPPTSSLTCLLGSKALPGAGKFTLDFDFNFDDTDAGGTNQVIVAEINFGLMKPNDAGLQDATYQFLVSAGGAATWQLLDYSPNADGGMGTYVSQGLAYASPFVEQHVWCHISLVANNFALAPTGSGTSYCANANPVVMTPFTTTNAHGLSGVGTLSLGYSNNNQSNAPHWSVLFDNVVYATE